MLPWRELQLSRDISKGKSILGLFMSAHSTAGCWKSSATPSVAADTLDAMAMRSVETPCEYLA